MCLNRNNDYIRITFSLFADNAENYEKNFKTWFKKVIKIHEKSVLVAIKMETKNTVQNNIDKSWNMSKMDPKMRAQTRWFFVHLAPFFRARRPWEPKWLPSLPQEPPRPVQASISIDF